MIGLPDFRLERPRSASAAVELRAANPASRFLAGGTDLLPNMRRGLATADLLIDLGGIDELREIREEAGTLRLGAGVTLATIATHPLVRDRLPALACAAEGVAGPTHRNAATLGGNLCLDTRCQYYNQGQSWREGLGYCLKLEGDCCRVATKSPRCYAAYSGDIAPSMLVLDATVELLSPLGARRLPVREFYLDDGRAWLALAEDEMLIGVEIPLAEGWRSTYEKVRVRGATDFPLAGVAVALRRDGAAVGDLRIACTGVSSRPELVDGLEPLHGRPLDEEGLALVDQRIARCTQPMETTLVRPSYRRRVLPVLARRVLRGLWEGAPAR